MGCHFLLQGIFPTQRCKLDLLHCNQILYLVWNTREALSNILRKVIIIFVRWADFGCERIHRNVNKRRKQRFYLLSKRGKGPDTQSGVGPKRWGFESFIEFQKAMYRQRGWSGASQVALVVEKKKKLTCQFRRHKRHGFEPWVGKIIPGEIMATHSSILAWSFPCTKEPGGVAKSQTRLKRLSKPHLYLGWLNFYRICFFQRNRPTVFSNFPVIEGLKETW